MAFLDRVTRRRLVLGLLLVASLALLTVYFREQDSGRLHGVQRSLSDAASPAEGAVQRVAQPFRDAWSWSRDLVDAKSERDRLAAENENLKRQLGFWQNLAAPNKAKSQVVNFVEDPRFTANLQGSWSLVGPRVVARAPIVYSPKVQIDAGTAKGVPNHDPLVPGDGWLVGQIAAVSCRSPWVPLIKDGSAGEAAWIPRPQAAV